MAKFAAGIQYDGTAYCGWQKQLNAESVQQYVEESVSKVANEIVAVFCSGRTDTGVHAKEQLIHFESHAKRSSYAWRMGCNSSLPKDIRLLWCHEIDTDFHARFSAMARQYRYIIYNSTVESALLRNRINWVPYELNVDNMHLAAQSLTGENDFTSFRASGCQANTPFRNVHKVSIIRQSDYIIIDITANAFLHHMVRNIVGSLIEIGRGRQSVTWIEELLILKDRKKAAATAPAKGLYFVKSLYPEKYKLDQLPASFDIFL